MITPEQIDALPTYTSAQQLKMWQLADIVVSQNQSYVINGRTYTRADAKVITDKIQFWENRVAIEANGVNGTNVLINFLEPQ